MGSFVMIRFEELLDDISITKEGLIDLPTNAIKASGVYVLYLEKADIYYVGSTVDLWVRFVSHRNTLRLNKHANRLLQREYNRYSNNVIRILFVITSTVDEARDLEQKLIDKYFQTDMLANLWSRVGVGCDGRAAGMSGKKHSDETKSMIRQRNAEQFSDPEARKRHSEITKEKLKDPKIRARIKEAQLKGIKKYKEENDLSAKLKALWEIPGAKEKHLASMSHRFIKVQIDGIEYESVNAAARAIGISNFGIKNRIASKKFPTYVYVKPH